MNNNDRILPFTRVIAAIVVPFLLLAFLILYFFPEQSGQRFAWAIQPSLTAMFMGAGYLGGSWLFINAIFGRRWHRVAPGFPAVTTFATAMLLVTLVHWDRFDLGHFPFQLWLILYVVTPFLVPFVWLRNRAATDSTTSAAAPMVPAGARWSLGVLGLFLFGFSLAGFMAPAWLIDLWPWQLSPVTARIMSGWFALLGVGGLVIAQERRWSAWEVGLQSIGLWQLLVLVAAVLNRADFKNGLLNWYTISVALVLAGMAGLYAVMRWQRLAIDKDG